MPDIADEACVHPLSELHELGNALVWSCTDCGRGFSSTTETSVENRQQWAYRAGVPDRVIARWLRSIA